ncbi:Rossmann-fold NAD(P)-binding domain-containing protein [Flindersiella endophytica]
MTTQAGTQRKRLVWLITGTSSGFGRALAEAVLDRGDAVIAAARDPRRVTELVERHRGRAIAVQLDVTRPEDADAAVEAGIDSFERIDVVVNAAGYGLFGALEELSLDQWRRQFETNVFGPLNVTRAALPQLRKQRSGHIVQFSSLDGVAPALPGEAAYAASKFALEGLSEVLAKEVAHLGLKVTIVEPGPFRTAFAAGATANAVEIDDYQESVGEALRWFEQIAGSQPGDPSKAAAAIIAAVDAADPPLRLPLGQEAYEMIRTKLDDQRRELDAVAGPRTTGTAFAEGRGDTAG